MYGVKIIPSPSDKVPSPRLAYQAPQKWGIAFFSLFLTIFIFFFLGLVPKVWRHSTRVESECINGWCSEELPGSPFRDTQHLEYT